MRTVWRDLGVLQEAGFPIYDEGDGRRGVWTTVREAIRREAEAVALAWAPARKPPARAAAVAARPARRASIPRTLGRAR